MEIGSHRSSKKGKKSEISQDYSYSRSGIEEKAFSEKSSQKLRTPVSHSMKSKNDSVIGSITNSVTTDSSFSQSYHNHVEPIKIEGPPPLKRTFLSDEEEEDEIDEMLMSHNFPQYQQPEWHFPVKRIAKNDDDHFYETLRTRFSVKNIVTQLKHSA